MDKTKILIADIGGTKSDIALFDTSDIRKPLQQQRYINAHYSGIEEILLEFKAMVGELPAMACFAVAGPVKGNVARMTNLPWTISIPVLEKQFHFNCTAIINDLTAVASSINYLDGDNDEELLTIYKGDGLGGAVAGVVAPGTGLGEGYVVTTAKGIFVTGSEGGHTDFAPVNDEQLALLQWAKKEQALVSYETLIAGPGIARLYDFCSLYHELPKSEAVEAVIAKNSDRTPAIIEGATSASPCTLCQKTVELFLTILGSEAGNLALKLYAKGGIYLGGGILPRLVGYVSFDNFIGSYLNKGDMSSLVQEIPVRLIVHKNAALLGAAAYLLETLESRGIKE